MIPYVIHRCPGCFRTFTISLITPTLPVRLGPGTHTCKGCGNAIEDGSKEWWEMSLWERFRFFFPALGFPLYLIALIQVLSEVGAPGMKLVWSAFVNALVTATFMSPYWIYLVFKIKTRSR